MHNKQQAVSMLLSFGAYLTNKAVGPRDQAVRLAWRPHVGGRLVGNRDATCSAAACFCARRPQARGLMLWAPGCRGFVREMRMNSKHWANQPTAMSRS